MKNPSVFADGFFIVRDWLWPATSTPQSGVSRWFGVGQTLAEVSFEKVWPEKHEVRYPVPSPSTSERRRARPAIQSPEPRCLCLLMIKNKY
jgi:hypothetical protein